MQPLPGVQAVVLAFVVTVSSIVLLTWTPAFAAFVLAIAAAICWCIWLEQHPTA